MPMPRTEGNLMRLRNIKRQQARKARPKQPVPPELRTQTRYGASKRLPGVGGVGDLQSRFEKDQKRIRTCGICGKAQRDCGCAELLAILSGDPA